MKKILYITALVFSINLLLSNVFAYVTEDEMTRDKERIKISTFVDYAPYGTIRGSGDAVDMESFFMPDLRDLLHGEYKYNFTNIATGSDVENARALRAGNIDVLLGVYHATKTYNGIDFVFPAMLNNPIHVAMMPDRIREVSSRADLKKLKGVRVKTEKFNDYVENELKGYNFVEVDNMNQAYEKLYVGDVDYVLGGYYYMLLEATKLGLRPYISFSQSELWNVPIFIGVSKATKLDRKSLMKILTAWSNSQKVKDSIKNNLRNIILDAEEKYAGTVPPMYIKQEAAQNDGQTKEEGEE